MTSRSALSGGPEVAQATPTGLLHSAARGQRGAGQERWTGGRRGGGSDAILSGVIPTQRWLCPGGWLWHAGSKP
jgi:hypothetical protein